ncbi:MULTISPECIES: HAD family hydrolase [Sphingobacterium]|uniref:HAD family hydrolase n=1 Tax=Sphingobacterium TaxID=28453 RepID=UPI0013D9EF58|nr:MULTISPECIES: HAD family phosphatase [unclassified Sphingobacterium]
MQEIAILFDMDGVIAHTNPYHSKAFEAFFDKHNISYNLAQFEQHMYGKHNSYIMSHFFNRKIEGEELIDLEREKEGLFRDIYAQYVKDIPGYIDFLKLLKQEKVKTGVATSAPRANMDLIVDGLNIRNMMDSFMCSEDVEKHKPDPEIYLKSAAKLNVPKERCLVFEDSFSGVSAAINAKMKVVGVLSSHSKSELPPCDLYISDYTEIQLHSLLNLID